MARRYKRYDGSCKVCSGDVKLDYKQPNTLKQFTNRLGKILPRRTTRLCAKHQRKVATEIKRARHLALLPYGDEHGSSWR